MENQEDGGKYKMNKQPIETQSVSVELKQLVKKFNTFDKENEFTAVDHINLKINPGELITLLGPSGCGKTTTLRMLAGFEFPTSGNIFVEGNDIAKLRPNKRDIGMVFQSYSLFPHLTVFENVIYGLKLKKIDKNERINLVNTALDIMHLNELKNRSPGQLSGGQQQRVALVRSIVNEPKILLFDEPLSNLAAKLREYMRKELRSIQKRLAITSLYVTHDQIEAMAISDQIVLMNKAVIQQIDPPHKIYNNPIMHFVAELIRKANFVEATVKRIDKDNITLSMLDQKITTSNHVSFPIKQAQKVDCVIRPEFWRIDHNGKFKGKVINTLFLGESVEYNIELNGQTITVSDFEHYINGIKSIGEELNLSVREKSVSLLEKNKEEM